MVRTQIQLTEELFEETHKAAAAQGVSMAEYVRRSLARSLEQEQNAEARKQALELIGCVRSEEGDLSENHDKYLAEFYSR